MTLEYMLCFSARPSFFGVYILRDLLHILFTVFSKQAFKEAKAAMKPPGVFKTLVGVVSEVRTANNLENSCKLLLPSS